MCSSVMVSNLTMWVLKRTRAKMKQRSLGWFKLRSNICSALVNCSCLQLKTNIVQGSFVIQSEHNNFFLFSFFLSFEARNVQLWWIAVAFKQNNNKSGNTFSFSLCLELKIKTMALQKNRYGTCFNVAVCAYTRRNSVGKRIIKIGPSGHPKYTGYTTKWPHSL